ncbi:hypothetical protein EXIGLDRAFT_780343 [Exidia glandulosa HHB12029]|uniref:Uncharacterized protein n=1 Tax=Exidia glandulosa HHB12029 TaxID=1314781 RepID=A0A165BN68_EXIGL|nr:hypothetical protein EXIGLDRAFT_780343 [Exidia glandulosa HHB12029]
MARVVEDLSPGADPDAASIRLELTRLRDRRRVWRHLQGLFPVTRDGYPIVLAMLERWVALEQFEVPSVDQTKVARRYKELNGALKDYEELFAATKRVSEADHRAFVIKVCDCVLTWAAAVSVAAAEDVSEEEYNWISRRNSVEAAQGVLAERPDLSDAHADLAKRRQTLLNALDGDSDEDEDEGEATPAPPKIIWETAPTATSRKRVTPPPSQSQSKRKKQRVTSPEEVSGESERSEEEDEDEDTSTSAPRKAKQGASSTVREGPNGVKEHDVADTPVNLLFVDGGCLARLGKRNPIRLIACERCTRGGSCRGGVWSGVSGGSNQSDVTLSSLETSLEGLHDAIDEQSEEIKTLKDAVDAQMVLLKELRSMLASVARAATPSAANVA